MLLCSRESHDTHRAIMSTWGRLICARNSLYFLLFLALVLGVSGRVVVRWCQRMDGRVHGEWWMGRVM